MVSSRRTKDGEVKGLTEEDEQARSIRFSKNVWQAIDADARRCKRSAVKQMEALFAIYYDLADVEIDQERLRAIDLSPKSLHVYEPEDTNSVKGRTRKNIKGLQLEPERPCPSCGRATSYPICPSCGHAVGSPDELAEADLDRLPFGVIRLTAEGRIIDFNKHEEERARKLAHISEKQIKGKNFFTDIARCTKVQKFRGRFEKFLAGDKESEEFEFDYPFAHVQIVFLKEDKHIGYVVTIRSEPKRKTGTKD